MPKTLLLIVIICFILTGLIQLRIDRQYCGREKLVEELMYFPSGKFIHGIACGYDELLADWVWLRAIQYYGGHRRTDMRFDYLGHILDILTDLDPKFIHAYTFGALLLTDDVGTPDRGLALLAKGAAQNPSAWEIPFIAGFINYVFLKNYEDACTHFVISGSISDSPDFTRRFAAFVCAKKGDIDLSIELWTTIYTTSKNKIEIETALRNIKKLTVSKLGQVLEKFFASYKRFPTNLRELVYAGFLNKIPVAPDGGKYYISGNKIKSTTLKDERIP